MGAARVLGPIGETASEAGPEMIKALSDEDSSMRSSAAEALGRIGEAASEAGPEMIKALGTADDSVCNSAAEALGRIGTPEALQAVNNQSDGENP